MKEVIEYEEGGKVYVREYLPNFARCYTTGTYLIWDEENNAWLFDGTEDDTFYNGEVVSFDNNRPYLIKERGTK